MTVFGSRSGLIRSGLWMIPVSIVVLILAILAKNHFGPLDAICNGSLEFEPHQSAGEIANCSLDTTLYSVGVYAFWGAIVAGALGVVALICGVAAAEVEQPRKTVTSTGSPSNVSTTTARVTMSTARAEQTPRRSAKASPRPARVRCSSCDALNDVQAASTRCFACDTQLNGG